jgi:hypothetical protein
MSDETNSNHMLVCKVVDVDEALVRSFDRFFSENKKKLSELKDLIQEELSNVQFFQHEIKKD